MASVVEPKVYASNGNKSQAPIRPLNDYYDVRLKNRWPSGNPDRPVAKTSTGGDVLFEAHKFVSVHLAARAGVWHSMENPYIYMSTNTVGTLNLLEAMRHKGVKKMVLASTSSLYAGQKMPYSRNAASQHSGISVRRHQKGR